MHILLPGHADPDARRIIAFVERLRLLLPLAIFLVVLVHQAWETATVDDWSPTARFVVGLLSYGLVGPLIAYRTLDWIARALTKQRAAEALRAKNEALKVANAELTELDALKDEFVALVSHELRAPLTNINASVELLLMQQPADGAREKLEIIGQEASRLTRLVQSVLDVSRMEAGRMAVHTAPADAEDLCRAAIDRVRATDPGRAWLVDVAPDTPPVLVDEDRTIEVLCNLLENAAKYSPPGTRVDIQARHLPDEDAVLVAVTDRGVGIPEAEMERIFERFHRVERGDARESYGHGLGLYIARKLVELQDGRLWAESTLGEGSTFLLTLPAAPEEP